MSITLVMNLVILPCVAQPFGVALLSGKPIDAVAAGHLKQIGEMMARPPAERNLKPEAVGAYRRLLKEDNPDRRLCAALALGLADDEESLTLLREAERSPSVPLAGAAKFSLFARGAGGRDGIDLRAARDRLASSGNPYERLFLANRMAVDHPKRSVPVLLAAAKREEDPIVRYDLLYYLCRADDPEIDREILLLSWPERDAPPENIGFFLMALTPGRRAEDVGKSGGEMLADVSRRSRNRP